MSTYSPAINLPIRTNQPRRKQLSKRGREHFVARRRAMWVSGNSVRLLTGKVASALPPTLTTHKVATAMASQWRAARAGSVIWVCCHCQPPRLVSLKPLSIQARRAYQHTSACSGDRSVTISQASVWWSSRRARRVHFKALLLKHITRPHQASPAWVATPANDCQALSPSRRYLPPALMRRKGCQSNGCASPSRTLMQNLLDVAFQGPLVRLRHVCGPRTKRARSRRSISNGVMHLMPRPMQASGILILFVEVDAISWVTIVWPCASDWATK